MNTEAQENMSQEEKFFGVRTQIGKKSDEAEDAVPVEVQAEEDEPTDTPTAKVNDVSHETSDDDELSEYGERVQKRIKKLTWRAHEAERQRDDAQRMREEAVRVTQQLVGQNRQFQDIINSGEAHLVQQFKDRAGLAIMNARKEYQKAYEEGDTEAIIAAQEALIRANAELREAEDYDADYQYRSRQYQVARQRPQMPPVQSQPQPGPAQVAKPTERAQKWAEENKWFNHPDHKDMTALAFGVHEDLIRNHGYQPDTEEYFTEINRVMRQRFPEYFGQESGSEDTSASPDRKPSTVVAPAARNNGARPRKVKLTPTQIALAKRLGITPEQYAQELLKEAQ